jgi:hypothetical protein
MTERAAPPQRVRITHPRTEAARRAPARPAVREINEQTQLGEVYMSSLIRSQRRLAVVVVSTIGVLLAGTSLATAVAPRLARLHALGIPLPWLLLGILIYPTLIVLAWYTVRHAERNERAFTELVRGRR